MSGDERDTEPVLMSGDTRVEFTSAVVPAGTRREVVLKLEQPMPRARVFASTEPRDRDGLVTLEAMSCGGIPLPGLKDGVALESLRFGLELGASLAKGSEVTFEVKNGSGADTRVGVSVVTGQDPAGQDPAEKIVGDKG